MNTNHWLVGRRVLNVHRQSCDYSQEYRDAHKGTVIGVEEGCNAIIWVQFDGLEFQSAMCQSDLAYCELWPREGCRVNLDAAPNLQQPTIEKHFNTLGEHIGWCVQFNGVVVYLTPDEGGVDVDIHGPDYFYESVFVPNKELP